METHFLSLSVKKIKIIGNDMWDVAMERRYTKLVEKLHMLSSSLYLRQVERRTPSVCGLCAGFSKESIENTVLSS
ncbi:hypothetical protein MKX03_003310 [Papaver bracteatum]|nr:hypothetical protein MKX03_003310 [Papaver bracteatum]